MSKNKLPDLAKKASVKRQLTVNLATTLHVLTKQGLKLKKSSGHLLATNWRNIVTRCKFLVTSLYNVNDAAYSQGLWYFALSQSREIHKNMQNTAKFGRNLIKYTSVQHIWNFLSYWGYLLAVNLYIYFETSSLKRANNAPKLRNYQA